MMRALAGLAAAAIAAVLAGNGVAAAQGMEPAELPPAGFSGNQYVDSQGCVFLRAGLGDKTTWVARLGSDRKPVCGHAPTLAEGAATAPAPAAAAPAATAEPAPAKAAEPAATTEPAKVAKSADPAPRKRRAAAPAATTIALVVSKPVAPDATYCTAGKGAAQRYLLSDGRRVTRCGQAKDEAVAYLNGLDAPGLVVSDRAPTAVEARRARAAEAGPYRVTWSRGKLSAEAEVSTGTAEAGQGAYIQIGAFADPANADRAMQRLEGLGLPASSSSGRLTVILAGPFASQADLSGALTLLRQNGYGDAFPTRG